MQFATKAKLNGSTAKYDPGNDLMLIQTTANAMDAVHETVHAINDQKGWHQGRNTRDDEADAWGIQELLNTAAMLRQLESLQGQSAATTAKNAWTNAWGPRGFSGLTAGAPSGAQFGYQDFWGQHLQDYFTDVDFWDINAKFGVRFSEATLRAIYESLLAQHGVTEADGSRLILPVISIPAGSPFN